jgi:hypothetical protein
VKRRRTAETLFWTNISAENIITELMATPRGAGIDELGRIWNKLSTKMFYGWIPY